MHDLERLLGTFGFPVAVACYLLWFQNTLMREVRDHLAALRELMKLQAAALAELSAALRSLVEREKS